VVCQCALTPLVSTRPRLGPKGDRLREGPRARGGAVRQAGCARSRGCPAVTESYDSPFYEASPAEGHRADAQPHTDTAAVPYAEDDGAAQGISEEQAMENPILGLDVRSVPGLSRRLVNSLLRHNLHTLSDAVPLADEELIKLRGFGIGQLEELRALDLRTLSVAATANPARPTGGTPPPVLSSMAAVDSLPLPAGILKALLSLGATTISDITSFTPEDLEPLHGLGRPGTLMVEQYLVSNSVPWEGATLRAQPTLSARQAGRVTLIEAGLTEAALAELGAKHTDLRDLSTWEAATLASVVSMATFAEAQAAMSWYGLPFIDTASTDTFVEGVRHIREHYNEHGFVPGAREVYKDFRLGQWVMMIRGAYKADRLDPPRIHVLESLPFWTWAGGRGEGIAAKRLAEILRAARSYASEHGHLDLPLGDEEAFLARGLESVRDAREHLSIAAGADFAALPEWTWDQTEADARRRRRFAPQSTGERPPSARWLARLAELRAEALAAGGLEKASLRGGELERIGHWASTQRVRRGSLSSAQCELLEKIPGWTWDGMAARDARRWDESIARLEAYVTAGNTPNVPAAFRYDGFGLGDWVRRQHGSRASLSSEQVERLEAVPGWAWREFNPRLSRTPRASRATALRREVKWEATRLIAQRFYQEHHYWPSSSTVTDSGLALGIWAITQRSLRSRGELSSRRKAALEATPGWRWNGQAQRGRSGPNLRHVCTTLGIRPGAILHARGTKYEAEAFLDEEFRVEVVSTPGEGAYETPTRAWARATAGRSTQNGWDAWSIEYDGDMTPLRTLRNRVIALDLELGEDGSSESRDTPN
jgi:hypothetical protein